MSKRDSLTANLPGREDMAEDMDTQESYLGHVETAASSLPMAHHFPTNFPSATPPALTSASSTVHHAPRDLPYLAATSETLHPREHRAQTVHTIKFQRMVPGSWPPELKVEETDHSGFSKLKTLEHNFYGIVGHIDQQVDGWRTAQHLANYWRDYFGVDREGDAFPSSVTTPLGHLCLPQHGRRCM